MKRLNKEEIKQMADALMMTEQEAQEVADIFANIYEKEQGGKRGWKINQLLESVDNYIDEWEGHWHREFGWEEFYSYEKEEFYSYYDDAEAIFETVETFKEYIRINGFAYELKCSNMIIIVC